MIKQYTDYKKSLSPFERIIPAHWEEKKLMQWYRLKSVQNNDGEELLSVYLNRGVIRYSDSTGKQVHKPSDDTSKYQLVEPDDFVLNNQQAWRGSVGVSKYRGIISPAYYIWEPRNPRVLNPEFMNYLVRDSAVVDQFVLASKGVGSIQRQIYVPYMKTVILAVPPKDEQDKIVDFLNWKIGEMHRFIRETRNEIDYLNELKHSIIVKAITSGLDEDVRKKSSTISFVKEIPAHWEELMLFQIASEQKIPNKTVHHQNSLSLSYGKIKRKDINTKGGLLPASFDTYQIVNDGNVILRLTDLQNDHKSLRVGLATETGIITSAYTCLKPRDNILPEYLYLMLHAYDVSKVFYGMGGGVRQSIGYADIRRMTIPLPPLDEQQAIVDYCYSEQEKIEKLIDNLNDEIAYIQELRVRTISHVVTGKVDVRDIEIPEYETETSDIDDDISEDDDSEEVETVDEEVDE